MENNWLFKQVLKDFNEHININGNWFKELDNFHNKIEFKVIENNEFSLKRERVFIENKTLKELSKIILKDYKYLSLTDIYNLIPQILRKINCFIWFKSKNINVDYYYILSWYINFIPENEKPLNLWEYENNLKFFEEIIYKTLNNIEEDFKNYKFNFELTLPFQNLDKNKCIKIDNRITIEVDNTWKTIISGEYWDWNILDLLRKAFRDLYLILNILELEDILIIDDTNKRFWSWFLYQNVEKYDKSNFKYSNNFSSKYFLEIAYFEKQLKKFSLTNIWVLKLEYFYLLSDKIGDSQLVTSSFFFWTEKHRFTSKEYLNYWQSIEIMLWSPNFSIKKELINRFCLYFTWKESFIEKHWGIRNKIVHNWLLEVNNDDLYDIKKISKELFLKMIINKYLWTT
jgi:hypothetical protein